MCYASSAVYALPMNTLHPSDPIPIRPGADVEFTIAQQRALLALAHEATAPGVLEPGSTYMEAALMGICTLLELVRVHPEYVRALDTNPVSDDVRREMDEFVREFPLWASTAPTAPVHPQS